MDSRQSVERRRGRGSAAAAHISTGVRDFGQLALWMAATLAGLVSAVLVARTAHFRRMERAVGRSAGLPGRHRRRVDKPTPEESLPLLAEAIIGNSRSSVAAVFGPPRGAIVSGPVSLGDAGSAMWQAQTWYYPLRQQQSLAMAIEFDDDAARHVEFFKAPGAVAA